MHIRPAELPILEPLGEQADSRAVPEDQLHAIGSFRPEHIDGAGERIGLHRLTHRRRQTFRPLAEADWLRRHHHADRASRADHAPAFKARSTAATVFASAPRPTRTITPSISTSMIPRASPRRRLLGLPRLREGSGGGSTTAGTNRDASPPAFAAEG